MKSSIIWDNLLKKGWNWCFGLTSISFWLIVDRSDSWLQPPWSNCSAVISPIADSIIDKSNSFILFFIRPFQLSDNSTITCLENNIDDRWQMMQYSVKKRPKCFRLSQFPWILFVTKDVASIQSNWYQKIPLCRVLKATITTTNNEDECCFILSFSFFFIKREKKRYFYNCLNITFFTSSVSSFYWLFYKFLSGREKQRARCFKV